MGILEDQRHQLDVDSLYSTNPEIRAAAIRRLAAGEGGALQQSARRAEREALAERTKWIWSKQNPSFALEANFEVMEKYLAEAGIQISDDVYDLAFHACRNQLAERVLEVPEPTTEEIRIARNEKLKSMSKEELREQLRQDVRRRFEVPTWTPDFTAKQFKQMSPSQAFAILRYPNGQQREGAAAAIDKLLQDAQLLQDQSATK
jgi:hypothetical protein